jgi:prevent-host-death family protein
VDVGTVTVRDLRNHSADVLARVAHGESLTITRDGDPVAAVTPLPRHAATLDQLIARRRALPRVDARALRDDLDDLLDATL